MKTPMSFFPKWLLIIFFTLILGGCGAKFDNISPSEQFLTTKEKSIALTWLYPVLMNPEVWADKPKETANFFPAGHIMLGTQGLLDGVVNNALASDLKGALAEIEVDKLMQTQFFDLFKAAFEENGFSVKVKTTPYCVRDFKLWHDEQCTNEIIQTDQELLGVYQIPQFRAIFDFKPMMDELDVDYVLFAQLLHMGTGRNYYSMIPTSDPQGITMMFLYLVERNTGSIIGQHFVSLTESTLGDWDQPPKYENLMAAAHKSFETAIDEMYISIFKQAP